MGLLEQVAVGQNMNCIPTTGILAEPTARAILLDHTGLAEEVKRRIRYLKHECIEGTDVNAEFAATANTLLWVYMGAGELLARELAANVAVSSRMDSTGQTAPHAPQSMQSTGSM